MSEKDKIIREAGDYLEYNEIPKGKPGEAMLTHLRDSVKAAENLEEANKQQGRLCQDAEMRYNQMTTAELDALLQDQYQDRECREFLVDGAILTCTNSTRKDQWVKKESHIEEKKIEAAEGVDMKAEGIKMDQKGSGELLDPDRVFRNLVTKENGMWTDGKRHATIMDCDAGNNIPCFGNCRRPPDSEEERALIEEMYWDGKAEGKIPKEDWGTCYCLRKLEEEWENYYIWGRTYATFPTETGELASGITMTSMLFCKHGGFIYPVTSGQGAVCRVEEEAEEVIEEEERELQDNNTGGFQFTLEDLHECGWGDAKEEDLKKLNQAMTDFNVTSEDSAIMMLATMLVESGNCSRAREGDGSKYNLNRGQDWKAYIADLRAKGNKVGIMIGGKEELGIYR